ncbi:hypothetical protein Lser_V15G05779 [Lactuca serriola]
MEEPQEVHTDENRALPEKKQKRIVKTPAQVAALENFYNEHKYPTEGMKQELADSIGLTEKQVSGWFCHRRLKDKKSPNDEILPPGNGKQDRSSGVIQDRGSGLRQDSCGSTKQGDNKHSDPKEVESRRFTTQNILPLQIQHNNIIMDHHHHDVDRDDHDGNDDDDDDTSSGSSSPLKDSFHPQNVVGAITSKYPSHDFKSVRGRGGPSGYLKVKGQVENAAITAVKRQLGRQYREDGPPLGIEFEALPPGAFENPVKIPVNQSYYVGDRSASALHSSDGSRTFQPPNASKMYERYNPKSYNSMDLDNSPLDIRHASKHREKHFDNQCNNNNNKQTPHFSKNRHSQSMEVNDDSAEETSIHDMRDHFETRIKHVHGHGPGVRRQQDSVSVSNRHLIGYGKNINHNIRPPPKVNYRDRVESLTSDLTVKRGEFLELEDRGMSRKIPKDEEFDGERRGIDEYSKLVSARIHPGNEMKVTKRSREEFLHQMYPRKEAVIDMPPRTIMTRPPPAQMTSSFSDDETAETTSSAD